MVATLNKKPYSGHSTAILSEKKNVNQKKKINFIIKLKFKTKCRRQ